MVEHLLAKEDVASSSLVTRSKLRLASQHMFYVYFLRSQSYQQIYVGLTTNLRARLSQHNSGRSVHTRKFAPWVLLAYFAFAKEKTGVAFERYLRSGSGPCVCHFL